MHHSIQIIQPRIYQVKGVALRIEVPGLLDDAVLPCSGSSSQIVESVLSSML